MPKTVAFTAAEVAFVLREPVKTVKKALDEGPVEPRLIKKAGGTVRTVDRTGLLYLFVVRALKDELTPLARVQLYHAMKRSPLEQEVHFGRLSVAIGDLIAEVHRREQELADLAEKVEFRQDGEAMLKGAGVEVHRIAALVDGGMTPGQVMEDYPSLTFEAIAAAKAYAEAYPKAGPPYPPTTFKHAAQGPGIGLEALDVVMDDGE
jgi:uncharacterized protein (DUF433 family)